MAATKASAARNTRTKKKERKNIAAGTAHIQSTFNNTIVTITDTQGNTVSWCSTGALNFPRFPQEHSLRCSVCR